MKKNLTNTGQEKAGVDLKSADLQRHRYIPEQVDLYSTSLRRGKVRNRTCASGQQAPAEEPK